jgi:hypothetical protein
MNLVSSLLLSVREENVWLDIYLYINIYIKINITTSLNEL